MSEENLRPPVWVGHIALGTPDLEGTCRFMLELGTVARKMVESRYHRVIVTDSDDKIVGIVSSLDILRLVGTVG